MFGTNVKDFLFGTVCSLPTPGTILALVYIHFYSIFSEINGCFVSDSDRFYVFYLLCLSFRNYFFLFLLFFYVLCFIVFIFYHIHLLIARSIPLSLSSSSKFKQKKNNNMGFMVLRVGLLPDNLPLVCIFLYFLYYYFSFLFFIKVN